MGGQKPITSLAIFLSIAEQLLEIRIINYSRRLTLAKKCGLVYKYCCSVFLLVTLFATVSFFFIWYWLDRNRKTSSIGPI